MEKPFEICRTSVGVSQVVLVINNLPSSSGKTQVRSLGWEDPLKEGMATLSSFLENPLDRGDWWATIHRVAQSQTQLKLLNMHT